MNKANDYDQTADDGSEAGMKASSDVPEGFAIHLGEGDDATVDAVVRRHGERCLHLEVGRRIVMDAWERYPHATIAFSRNEIALIPDAAGVYLLNIGEQHGLAGGYLGRHEGGFINLRSDLAEAIERARASFSGDVEEIRYANIRHRLEGRVLHIDLNDLLSRLPPPNEAVTTAPLPSRHSLPSVVEASSASLWLSGLVGLTLGLAICAFATHKEAPTGTPANSFPAMTDTVRAPSFPSVACPVPPLPPFPYTGPMALDPDEPAVNELETLRLPAPPSPPPPDTRQQPPCHPTSRSLDKVILPAIPFDIAPQVKDEASTVSPSSSHR